MQFLCERSAEGKKAQRVGKMTQTEITSKNVTSKEHLLQLLIAKAIR